MCHLHCTVHVADGGAPWSTGGRYVLVGGMEGRAYSHKPARHKIVWGIRFWFWGMPCTQCARSAHAVRTQCKVLYVGNYPNPSFGPFVEVCCSIVGFFKLLMHPRYDKFELSFIITYFHPFVPIFTPPPFFACMFLVVDGWWIMWTPTR